MCAARQTAGHCAGILAAIDWMQVTMIRVLIVDAGPGSAGSLAQLLAVDGFLTRSATSAAHAFHLARRFGPDVIVIDVDLPDVSGFSLLRLLRQSSQTGSAVMLATSSYSADNLARRCLDDGFDDYLPKPIDVSALGALIRTRLNSLETL